MNAGAIVAAILLHALGGCADQPWHGRDLARQDPAYVEGFLEAGWTVRIDYDLAASQEVWWDWFIEEQEPVGFAVYQHARTGIVPHVQTEGAEGDGTFKAPASGWYSLVWENQATENLTIQLRLPASSWGNRYPPGIDAMAEDPCPPGGLADCSVPWPLPRSP